MTAHDLLDVLWRDHVALAPQAERIHRLLVQRGELLRNDHLAFYLFDAPPWTPGGSAGSAPGCAQLARPFEVLGWRFHERREVRASGLRTSVWRHRDPALPGVLIGELAVEQLSPAGRAVIASLVGQLPPGFAERGDLPWAGRPWQLSHAAYQALAGESPLAGWIAAFGFRVHHVSVDVGSLSTFPDLDALTAFLIEHGFAFDGQEGVVKTAPADCLAWSSTCADAVSVAFADTTARIPSCCYEFVQRDRQRANEGICPTG